MLFLTICLIPGVATTSATDSVIVGRIARFSNGSSGDGGAADRHHTQTNFLIRAAAATDNFPTR